MLENHMLARLVDGFDEFRERLTRIEESVKPIADIKKDVDALKVNQTSVEASTKSAHKRIDTIEKEDFTRQLSELKNTIEPIVENEQEKKRDIKFLKNAVISSLIGMFFTVISGLILAITKGWL